MSKRVLAIINPISGRRNVAPVVRRIGLLLEAAGATFRAESTSRAGEAGELAAAAAGRFDAVLVVGGDGTVCEVVNGLIEHPLPIVILPTGTENLLARELDMPTDPAEVVAALLAGTSFPCDVGEASGRRFLAVCGVGFDAEVVARLTRTRRGHITHGDYFWPIWRTLWGHRFPCLDVVADGEPVFSGRGMAFVGIIGRYSLGMRLLGAAKYDDGLLDLCVLPCRTRRELIDHALRVVRGVHRTHASVVYRQVREVRIASADEDVLVEIDGDVGGRLPIRCTVLPGAARFLRHPG
jgi:YegS/Rv2252/BmrU family lipid kinase